MVACQQYDEAGGGERMVSRTDEALKPKKVSLNRR